MQWLGQQTIVEQIILEIMALLWRVYLLPHILVFLWYRNKRPVILEDLYAFTPREGGG